MSNEDPRPCERRCPECDQWKHHSRFRNWRRGVSTSTTIQFARLCRDCEQRTQNEKKNADRPASIVEGRAKSYASAAGVPKRFFMVNMNFQSLVPVVRAMMTPEALCTSCGHPFLNERDIQFEHREAPRHPQDWARKHARNIGIACASCNGTKLDKPYTQWLDEQEQCRLSNADQPTAVASGKPFQSSMDELWGST